MTSNNATPTSKTALWALILGTSALALVFGGIILLAVLELPFLWLIPLLGMFLAVGAITSGHIGIPRTSARHGRRGRPLAVTGLVLGYICIVLTLLVLPSLIVPQALDDLEDNPERMKQRAFSDAIRACESAMAEALSNGEEFRCEDAQDRLSSRWDDKVAIVDTAPNSCMILVMTDDSFTAAAIPWNYSP